MYRAGWRRGEHVQETRSYVLHSALLEARRAAVARLHRVNSAKRSLRPVLVLQYVAPADTDSLAMILNGFN